MYQIMPDLTPFKALTTMQHTIHLLVILKGDVLHKRSLKVFFLFFLLSTTCNQLKSFISFRIFEKEENSLKRVIVVIGTDHGKQKQINDITIKHLKIFMHTISNIEKLMKKQKISPTSCFLELPLDNKYDQFLGSESFKTLAKVTQKKFRCIQLIRSDVRTTDLIDSFNQLKDNLAFLSTPYETGQLETLAKFKSKISALKQEVLLVKTKSDILSSLKKLYEQLDKIVNKLKKLNLSNATQLEKKLLSKLVKEFGESYSKLKIFFKDAPETTIICDALLDTFDKKTTYKELVSSLKEANDLIAHQLNYKFADIYFLHQILKDQKGNESFKGSVLIVGEIHATNFEKYLTAIGYQLNKTMIKKLTPAYFEVITNISLSLKLNG